MLTRILCTLLVALSVAAPLLADSSKCNPSCTSTKHTCGTPNPPTPPNPPEPNYAGCYSIEVADFVFKKDHLYRILVCTPGTTFKPYGHVRSKVDGPARVWFPGASTRTVLWQVIDITPGCEPCALTKYQPNCQTKNQWVILGRGNVRPVIAAQ